MECAAAPRRRAWSAARPCRWRARPGNSRAKRSACNAIRWRPGRTLGLEVGQLNGDFGYPDRAHCQSAHHAQQHRYVDAGADAAAGAAAGDPRSVRQRARSGSARAPIYIPIAPTATGRAGPRRSISTSATPRRWRRPMPAISRRRWAISASPMRASSRRARRRVRWPWRA